MSSFNEPVALTQMIITVFSIGLCALLIGFSGGRASFDTETQEQAKALQLDIMSSS